MVGIVRIGLTRTFQGCLDADHISSRPYQKCFKKMSKLKYKSSDLLSDLWKRTTADRSLLQESGNAILVCHRVGWSSYEYCIYK